MAQPPPNWSDSNLCGRSFRGQTLVGANFQRSNLRGCDFSKANLEAANFSQAQIGLSRSRFIQALMLMAGSGAIAFHMLSQMIFSVLGLTPEDPNYLLRLILLGFLGLVGSLSGLLGRFRSTQTGLTIMALFEGLLLGFWIGGSVWPKNLTAVVIAGALGLMMFAVGITGGDRRRFRIIVQTQGVVFANGLFLFAGMNGLQAGFTRQIGLSLFWFSLMLLSLWFTLQSIGTLYQSLERLSWTCFAQANLEKARWH